MLFQKLADAHLDAGWSSIQQAIQSLLAQPKSAIELLTSTYASLNEMQQKLYLYSAQLVARVDQQGSLDGALLFEPPRLPDHRQGLEEGLRVLLTWLVGEGRTAEARGWAQLSRVLTEHLPGLDYLDKGAQVSLFCIEDKTSRFYLNLQPLPNESRVDILKHFDALDLYEKVHQLSAHQHLSLGGVGIEILPDGFRTKLYVRGRLSTLVEESRNCFPEIDGPKIDEASSGAFIRGNMDAEVAFESDTLGALRIKWVYFVDRPETGMKCAEKWVSRSPHWRRLKTVLDTLGGDKSLFALGVERDESESLPKRVNLYARKARDL